MSEGQQMGHLSSQLQQRPGPKVVVAQSALDVLLEGDPEGEEIKSPSVRQVKQGAAG